MASKVHRFFLEKSTFHRNAHERQELSIRWLKIFRPLCPFSHQTLYFTTAGFAKTEGVLFERVIPKNYFKEKYTFFSKKNFNKIGFLE